MSIASRIVLLALLAFPTAFANAAPERRPPATQPATKPGTGVQFLGLESQGKRVVFVCDATGTMINKFASLKAALATSVAALDAGQSFNIVFYFDGPKFLLLGKDPLPADEQNKRRAAAFLDGVTTSGTTDPIPALEAAFRQRPDVLYLMSDGEFNNLRSYDEVTNAIARANVGKRCRVNTILFETHSDESAAVLQRIALDHGGKYAFVREADADPAKLKAAGEK